MIMTDQEAVARLKAGDVGGLEILVRQYHSRATEAAFLVVGDWSLAEDITQSAFVNAYEHISSFDNSRPFGPWFFRSVVNSAIKVATQRRDQSLDLYGAAALEIPDPEPDVVVRLEAAETREEVLSALYQLSPGQRAAVVMKYYLDLSDVEASTQLQVPPGTVRRRLHDARKRLRQLLPTYGRD